jgi:hypothetical protein
MKLSDLLSELRENILHDRSDRVSGSTDYLWSDATLVRYINEAQNRFARRGLVLRDATTAEVCEVDLVTDTDTYTLHSSIIAVISVRHEDDAYDMVRTGHAALGMYQAPDTPYWDPSAVSALPAGKPLVWSTDEQVLADDTYDTLSTIQLRVYPKPSSTYNGDTLKLRVVRMPLVPLKATRLNVHPEIPSNHHLEMLDWAAYLALRVADIDAGSPMRAAEFRDSFEKHVEQARREAMRKMFAPTRWGFGRNGFSWEK